MLDMCYAHGMPQVQQMLKLLATSEAAEILGVSRATILKLVESGDLQPFARVAITRNGSWVFTPDAVNALKDRRAKAVTK